MNNLITDKYHFFWHGLFSQWNESPFVIDHEHYITAEQFMMSMKSKMFGDYDVLKEVMSTSSPKIQKALGRKVKNFDNDLWQKHCYEIVLKGNLAKYRQSKAHYDALLFTGKRMLVEASPYDKIWGIGMDIDHPDILDENKWLGTNLLGKVLMDVRKILIEA